MSVIKRLHRLTGESAGETERPTRSEQIAALRKRIDKIMAHRPESRPFASPPASRRSISLKDIIAGEDCHNAAGTCFIQQTSVDASTWHGHRRISDFAGLSMPAAAFLANNAILAGYRLEEGLFLDTETTGLAGGTGTMAFLIGLGWFEQGRFIVRQIFARDFAEERSALTHLADIAGARRFLVSFNGKTFDVGLLSTRYIMNRLQNPFALLPHLDLLYPARRLIAHRLENCRLATLEERVLGLVRQDDVPGSEIPQRYFDWLRGGDARPLRDVFTHNRLDIISLAALMGHLAELMHGRPDIARADARDLLALARLYNERQDTGQAQHLLTSLAESCETAVRMEALKTLSLIHKRAGRWEEAVGLWQQMAEDRSDDLFALIELAKWHEHRTHDVVTALKLVLQAIRHAGGQVTVAEREALLHRRRRLLQRQPEPPESND
ncbi:MAG: ribonuclease H-like domain-containing protein [Syntrophales bacterium]|nr:ribonuclease H-like domain-containing protein [Syntrophales bacterium]